MNNRYAERLTADNAVLTFIDHQAGLLVGVGDQDKLKLRNNIRGLATMGRIVGLPAIVTASMPGGPNGPVLPDLAELLPDATVINRDGEINAWDSSDYREAIEATGRRKIIMAGIVTDVCLLFPALSAVAEGYDVYAVVDASGTWDKLTQEAAMLRMSQAGVKISTWASVLAELMGDWRSTQGDELGQVLSQHLTSYGWVMNSFFADRSA